MSHALTTFSTRSPSWTGNDHEVQPRVCPAVTCAVSAIGPDTNRVAVLEPMVDARRRVTEDADPGERPQRQDGVGIVAAGREGVGARVAGPHLGPEASWSTASPPA